MLTRSQDKLPALSGLAQLYSDHLQDEYLAGLWRANLLTGIMWEHVSPEHGNVVAMDDRAPSWSWASIDGTIWYPDTSDGWQPECRILEASATPVVPGNVTGQVNGGHIVICDRLHEVILHPSTDGYLDAETLNTGQIHLHKGPGCEVLARLHGDPDLNDSSYLLPVFERPENDIQNFCMSRGLVLRRDATSGHYRRIGIFKTWSRSAKKTFSQSVWHLPPDRYEDFDGNDRYTIRIV